VVRFPAIAYCKHIPEILKICVFVIGILVLCLLLTYYCVGPNIRCC
jgi:hypothetical protein